MKKAIISTATVCALAVTAAPVEAVAEWADYNQIGLTGISRNVSWFLNRPGETRVMVCNVNGADGFLAVRSGLGTGNAEVRRLKQLATVEADARARRGLGANRSFREEGVHREHVRPPMPGWAHDGHLCSFIDYPALGDLDPSDVAEAPSPSNVRGAVTLVQAIGKPARCEWDNGNGGPTERYACQFRSFDGNGSFSVIREDGYELMLEVESPGMGTLVEFGDGRLVGDFGRVRRSESDPACWEAENGTARLCAR